MIVVPSGSNNISDDILNFATPRYRDRDRDRDRAGPVGSAGVDPPVCGDPVEGS